MPGVSIRVTLAVSGGRCNTCSNENTNGLLRQYFPKGTDLSFHGPGILANVAAELNARPRKRHDYRTPAEVLQELLSNPPKPTGDALTA